MIFVLSLMDQLGLPDPHLARLISEIELNIVRYTIDGVCTTDLSDNYCETKIQAAPAVDPQNICPGLQTLITQCGCCAASFVNFAEGICAIETTLDPSNTCMTGINNLLNTIKGCSETLGKTCAEIKYLLVHTATLSGVDPNWLQIAGNNPKLIAALTTAIAYAIGIDIAFITDLKIAAAASSTSGRRLLAAGDLTVTTTFKVPNNGVVLGTKVGLIGNMETLGMNELVASPGQLQGVTLTGQTTTNIATVGTSSASALYPLAGFLVALVLLQL